MEFFSWLAVTWHLSFDEWMNDDKLFKCYPDEISRSMAQYEWSFTTSCDVLRENIEEQYRREVVGTPY